MFLSMMNIWIVSVLMRQNRMFMPVRMSAIRAGGERTYVRMLMMCVVRMSVLVCDCYGCVRMGVTLGQVQPHA